MPYPYLYFKMKIYIHRTMEFVKLLHVKIIARKMNDAATWFLETKKAHNISKPAKLIMYE